MQYARLGSSGLKVSRIGLGMMSYGVRAERRVAAGRGRGRADRAARGRGGHHLLRHRRHLLRRSSARRSPAGCWPSSLPAATTTCWPPRSTTRWARAPTTAACPASTSWPASTLRLRRLGTDYVDLYQIHRWDYETPIEETHARRCTTWCESGKARYLGASSMYAWQFAKAQHVADAQRLDAIRVDAEPLQPDLPRGGAGDDPALRRPGHRRASRGP